MILRADWHWQPLGTVRPGDELIAVEAEKGLRTTCRTTVEAMRWSEQDAYKISTPNTEIIASGNHLWLSGNSRRWLRTDRLSMKSLIRWLGYCPAANQAFETDDYIKGYIAGITDGDGTMRYDPNTKPWHVQHYWRLAMMDVVALERVQRYLSRIGIALELQMMNHGSIYKLETRVGKNLAVIDKVYHPNADKDWQRGYVAGMFDAEGSLSGANLRIANTDIAYIQNVKNYLKADSFHCTIEKRELLGHRGRVIYSVRLVGDVLERMRFATTFHPGIYRKLAALTEYPIPIASTEIISIEYVGCRPLVDIQTGSGTFIANGLITHNCYMFRNSRTPMGGGRDPEKVVYFNLENAYKRTKTYGDIIFVNSNTDTFHEATSFEIIDSWFDLFRAFPDKQFQILTKRTNRMRQYCETRNIPENCWMGTSIEDQAHVFRADTLRRVKHKGIKFISFEPVIGRIDSCNLEGIHWAIVGGESDNKAPRVMEKEWAEHLCFDIIKKQGVALWFKQNGGIGGSGAGGDIAPDGNRYHEWPKFPITE